MNKQTYILSLGGSLIAPDGIDKNFLKKFCQALMASAKGRQFVIIPGGGQTARRYQKVASELDRPTNIDLDWICIKTNHLHSSLFRSIFGKYAHPEVKIG